MLLLLNLKLFAIKWYLSYYLLKTLFVLNRVFSIKMAFLIKKYPLEHRLKELLANQDLIQDIESYGSYSNENLYSDLCIILKKDEFEKEKSVLKKVKYFRHILN